MVSTQYIVPVFDTNLVIGYLVKEDPFNTVAHELAEKMENIYITNITKREARGTILRYFDGAFIELQKRLFFKEEDKKSPIVEFIVSKIYPFCVDKEIEEFIGLHDDLRIWFSVELEEKINTFANLKEPEESQRNRLLKYLSEFLQETKKLHDPNDERILIEFILGIPENGPEHYKKILFTGDKKFYKKTKNLLELVENDVFGDIDIELIVP